MHATLRPARPFIPRLAAMTAAVAMLAACSLMGRPSGGPGPGGPNGSTLAADRTFTLPVYANEPGRADATAKAECRRHGLHHQFLRTDGARAIYQCVSDAPMR
jgi:hypothetical protein